MTVKNSSAHWFTGFGKKVDDGNQPRRDLTGLDMGWRCSAIAIGAGPSRIDQPCYF